VLIALLALALRETAPVVLARRASLNSTAA
jgi:hypothetical protein